MIPSALSSEHGDRWIRIAAASAIALISLAGFVLLNVSERAAAADDDSLTAADYLVRDDLSASGGPARLRYEGPGGTESLANGGSLRLGDDVFLSVFLTPYPPSTFDVDVEFRLADAEGRPIDDAVVTVNWDMIFMWHGPFAARVDHIDDGRYIAPLDLFMFGPWEVVATIAAPGHEPLGDVSLTIYVWPE